MDRSSSSFQTMFELPFSTKFIFYRVQIWNTKLQYLHLVEKYLLLSLTQMHCHFGWLQTSVEHVASILGYTTSHIP